jgi:hypothetical protein
MPFVIIITISLKRYLKQIVYDYKMSEFLKNNKFLVHVASEVFCLCIIIMYIFKNNRGIYNHMQYLEQKLYACENVLEKHDQLLSTLLNRKVHSVQSQHQPSLQPTRQMPELSRSSSPPPSHPPPSHPPPSPSPPTQAVVFVQDDEDVEVIETPEVEEDNMDEEINEELNKLNLTHIKDS